MVRNARFHVGFLDAKSLDAHRLNWILPKGMLEKNKDPRMLYHDSMITDFKRKPLRCPFNQNLDGYAVYLAEFWRTPFNPNNFHQGILVQEIGNKNNELLYDVSGDFAEGGFKMRKREFDSKYFPYLDTRLVEILMPKEKLPLLEAIMANTPPPQCAADGNCQTWVKQVLDKAIPNPIKPVSLDKLVDF